MSATKAIMARTIQSDQSFKKKCHLGWMKNGSWQLSIIAKFS